MGGKKNKRKRAVEQPTIHPKNKYSDNPPDFALLASLYPSFEPFVFYSRDGRPRIDWTDFNATRELTRVLLLHDHGLNWWVPDGQLCPTVPNRSNYIHWIQDLLCSEIIPNSNANGDNVKGFDIGTGANCIYPLLGASLLGWNFVASDVTEVALEWAEKNVNSNPQITNLVEIRKVVSDEDSHTGIIEGKLSGTETDTSTGIGVESEPSLFSPSDVVTHADRRYSGPPILLGVVRDGEKFDFCMCNPPFFENMEEAGLNPKTSCGGTPMEMVCPGGEKAFISRIIEDSAMLKQSFWWYTSMVGRKSNLKYLMSKLREVGVTIVKTTEFVQGHTCRWGLAWSFVTPVRKIISPSVAEKNNISFMLEGIQRQFSAIHVLQSLESFFESSGATCKLDTSSFTVDINASNEHCNKILMSDCNEAGNIDHLLGSSNDSTSSLSASDNLRFRSSVFQQIPGTLLVKGSLQPRENPAKGFIHGENITRGRFCLQFPCQPRLFSSVFQRLEEFLRHKFCKGKEA